MAVGIEATDQQADSRQYSGFAQFFKNCEDRYETKAHNLVATVKMRSLSGREIVIERAPWFKNTRKIASSPPFFKNITIGMLETAGVMCGVVLDLKFYTALFDDELGIKAGEEIPYGEWQLTIKIDGDNISEQFGITLQMLPDGSTRHYELKRQ